MVRCEHLGIIECSSETEHWRLSKGGGKKGRKKRNILSSVCAELGLGCCMRAC